MGKNGETKQWLNYNIIFTKKREERKWKGKKEEEEEEG